MTRATRLRGIAVFFLLLLVHALTVNFTHHHAESGHPVARDVPAVSHDSHSPEEHLPQSQSEHCVACHLQRQTAAQEPSPVFTLAIAPPKLCRESFLFDPHLTGAFLTAAGRAPPRL